MPIYASAFFIPTSASIPYILEDVYLKGGYRSVATIAERDAIKTAARKQGALCYVRENQTIYWLPDAIVAGADAWKPFDVTKYVNFVWKDPLKMTVVDGKSEVSIDPKRIVPLIVDEQEGYVLFAGPDGPIWQEFEPLPSRANAQANWALILDANKDLIWGPVTGLPPTDGVSEGSAVVLGPDGPEWGAVSGGNKLRTLLSAGFFGVPVDGTATSVVDIPSGSVMVIQLGVDVPDVLITIHSSSAYNDTNPYAFRSAPAMLEDDGTSVAENGDVSRQRRYALFAAADIADPKMYITATNEGASQTDIHLTFTVLPLE